MVNKIVYSCQTELFEIELIIFIKVYWALNNLQMLIYHKNQPTNQPTHCWEIAPGEILGKPSIPWPKGNQKAIWTNLDQELSFILTTNLKGSIRQQIRFYKIIYGVCFVLFFQ